MTELERRLVEALRSLSEQYEREQRRQARQTQTLLLQLQGLERQVADLAADYKRLARLLRRS